MSTYKNAPELGPQLQAIRKSHNLTLEQLAERSGVSKSMLSQIERGQTNPTFATLWNLTQSLGIAITDLTMGDGASENQPIFLEHIPANLIPTIKSPDNKCTLRILSPVSTAGNVEWYQMEMQPDGTLKSQPHVVGTMEHLTCLQGSLHVDAGDTESILQAGETLRYQADIPHCIRNVSSDNSQAILIVISPRSS